MGIHEQDLPGIGRRYEIPVEKGGRLVIVIHRSGRRDVYLVKRGQDTPAWSLELTDDEARRAAAILGGAYFKPAVVDEIEDIVGEFLVDWVTLSPDAAAVGHSLLDMQIRRTTGMSVVAIVRGKQTITAPNPDEVFRAGDRLVVVGRHADMPRFVRYIETASGS